MKRGRPSVASEKTIGVFLQARLGSTRLKEKVLLPLADKSVVEHTMLSLKRAGADHYVLLVDQESETRLRPLAQRCGFELFVGPSTDVLARYAGAARVFPVECIVRATADNPLVSGRLVELLLDLHIASRAEFSGFVGMPLGLGVEIVDREALMVEDRESRDPYEREHVNPFLYRRPERFSILSPRVPVEFRLPDRSVTLDTKEDYRYLQRVFANLYHGKPIETEALVEWLRSHPRDPKKGEGPPGHESALHSVG